MIFGDERDRNIGKLIDFIRTHRIVPVPGSGRNLVQPIFVLDVVEALVRILDNAATAGKEYTLAGPEPLHYRTMVRMVAEALGRKVTLVSVPVGLVLAVARVCETCGFRLPLSVEQIQRMAEDRAFDITPACKELGFTPRTFAEGLALKLKGDV
jgi:nucleoside-diphosphate-sugar epimerase